MTTDRTDKHTRRWGGVVLGLMFLALGVIPGMLSGLKQAIADVTSER